MSKRNWTREELIVAFNLYCKIPFGRIHNRNPEIISLAKAIGRSPSAVAWKLSNFARLDPSLKRRGVVGARHGGKGDVEVWDEFSGNWEQLAFESERLLAQISGRKIEDALKADDEYLPAEGKERRSFVRVRVNQNFFRASVLAAYDSRCCITGLAVPELLNASHIVPWSVDSKNRVNPRNGLCLNAIHDRAFDRGLLTVTPDYRVRLSPALKLIPSDKAARQFLSSYEGVRIRLPHRFLPDPALLDYHNEHVLIK